MKKLCRGEVVIPQFERVSTSPTVIASEMSRAGLDESLLRDLHPRYVFARALSELSKGRLIEKLHEDDDKIDFQFNTKLMSEDQRLEYPFEGVASLYKKTGTITADSPGLQKSVREAFDKHASSRSTDDVQRLVKRLFKYAKVDLFSMRRDGGVYFVKDDHSAKSLVERVERFVRAMGGSFDRYKVEEEEGSSGYDGLRESISSGLDAMIKEHQASIERYTDDTRPSAMESRLEKLRETRSRIEAYALYMADEGDSLKKDLAALDEVLRSKIESAHEALVTA